jgi:hypothetical protein
VDKASMEEGLLWDLLYQNGQTSQAPLEFLLNPDHSYERISFLASPKFNLTAFHRLAMVGEGVRNDGTEGTNYRPLSHRLVDYLLSIFPDPKENLNLLTSRGETALEIAATNGNWYFVHSMLAAGADPTLGKLSALVIIVDRIILPTVMGGGFRGVAGRLREQRRKEENSGRMIASLLNWKVGRGTERDLSAAKRLMPKWAGVEYTHKGAVNALSRCRGREVRVKLEGGRLFIDEGRGEGFQRGETGDMIASEYFDFRYVGKYAD